MFVCETENLVRFRMNNLNGQYLGRYHIIEPLGQGGMASVYKAYDTTLERYIAIKIIRTDVSGTDDSGFLLRFRREARALAQLDHPYILKVLDYGEQEGIPYLVMPFEPGGTLKEKMGHPIPYQEAAAILAPVARALEYAHQLNIIHRDVKPANILMSHSGTPLLSDFGIAKILESGDATQLTATGVGIGTPDYMAPEQWMGNSSPQTDIYSLGVVFYEMVTGRRPFTADTPAAVLIKHLQDPLPRPRSFIADLPDDVEQVLFKALAKNAGDRFQKMGMFAEALERLARSERTFLVSVPTDIETIQNPVTPLSTLETVGKTVLAPSPAKGPETWKIGLIALAATLGLFLICILLGGGTYIASRLVATTGGNSQPTPGNPFFPGKTPIETPSQIPPFQTIDGFPEDIPILTDNNGDLATTVTEGMISYSFTSNLSAEQVTEFYKSGMVKNGWKQVSETTQSGHTSWYFTKGETRMVMVTVMIAKSRTMIVVMLVKN
jgi:serine/threonine protein kinase